MEEHSSRFCVSLVVCALATSQMFLLKKETYKTSIDQSNTVKVFLRNFLEIFEAEFNYTAMFLLCRFYLCVFVCTYCTRVCLCA